MNQFWIKLLPEFIRIKIENRYNLHKVVNNTGWLFIDRVLRMVIAMLVGIWVARYLGPEQFGLFSYTTAFAGLFAVLASLGLNKLTIREIVNAPDQNNVILGTTFGLQLTGGLATVVLSSSTILWLRPGETLTHWLVFITATSSIFNAFSAIDLWFQAQIKSKFTVIAKSAALVLSPALKVALILAQAPLITFAMAGLADVIIGVVGLMITYHLTGESMWRWRFSTTMAKRLLRESWPLIISALAIVIYMRIDQIMLKEMVGDRSTGLYSAAVRISEAWYFVPTTIVSSLFPILIAAREQGQAVTFQKYRATFRLLVGLAYAVAIPTTFLSDWLITTLYGVDYAGAGPILAIHIWAGVPVALGVASGPWLISEGFTKISLQRTLFGAVVNMILNLLLIPRYAGFGAAIATVVAYLCATLVWHLLDPRTRLMGQLQLRALLLL